jgi:hypothetical protein
MVTRFPTGMHPGVPEPPEMTCEDAMDFGRQDVAAIRFPADRVRVASGSVERLSAALVSEAAARFRVSIDPQPKGRIREVLHGTYRQEKEVDPACTDAHVERVALEVLLDAVRTSLAMARRAEDAPGRRMRP